MAKVVESGQESTRDHPELSLDIEVLEIQELEFSEFEQFDDSGDDRKQFLVASCTTCTCTCSCCTSI
jgi:thiazolylpeptide-type bacteriocin precursor